MQTRFLILDCKFLIHLLMVQLPKLIPINMHLIVNNPMVSHSLSWYIISVIFLLYCLHVCTFKISSISLSLKYYILSKMFKFLVLWLMWLLCIFHICFNSSHRLGLESSKSSFIFKWFSRTYYYVSI